MPGVVQYDSSRDSRGVSKSHGHDDRVTSAHRQAQRAGASAASSPPRTTGSAYDSYQPPYPYQSNPTAYGLNEPQWSVGPPPLIRERSPYARVPLPPMAAHGFPISVHPLLTAGASLGSTITWCVTKPEFAANLSSSSSSIPYIWKVLPALSPSSTSTLTIRVPAFSRPIVVFPKDSHSGGVITIKDVLDAVYQGLRRGANDVLCETMGISPSLFDSQIRVGGYPQMVTQSGGSSAPRGDDQVSMHISHCMDYATQWVGLAPSPNERDVWVLHTKRAPGR